MAARSVAVNLLLNPAGYVAGASQVNRANAAMTAGVTGTATKATAATTAMTTGFKRTGTSMANAAGQAGLLRSGITTPIAAAGAAIVGTTKASIDWESAWAGVTKTVDGSEQQLSALEGDLRDMAKTLPATHGEIASVAEAAGQLGVATEDVSDFSRVMIDLGETTNLTADQAATNIARITNIMGTAQSDVDNFGSALVDLGNNSATTEAEILEFTNRIAAAGNVAGLSESDLLAFGAAFSSVGVRAERGGTALSKVFTSINDSVIDADERLVVFAETAGMSADEFATAFREDPAQAVASFIDGLGEMSAAGESTTAVFEGLELTDQRLMQALIAAAEAGDLLTDSIGLASEAFEENTALSEEAQRRYDTMAASLSRARNQIRDAAIDIGDMLAPTVEQTASQFATLVGWVQTAAEEVENFPSRLFGEKIAGQTQEESGVNFAFGPLGPPSLDWSVLWEENADDAAESTESFITQLRTGIESAIPDFVEGMDQAAPVLDEVETEARQTAAQIEGLTDSLFASGQEAILLEEREYALSEAIDRAWEASRDDTASKEDQRDALRDVATTTQDLVLDMFAQGAATDDIITKTDNARQEFIDVATAILGDAEAAEELADKYGLIPGEVLTVVTLRDLATEDIGNIRDRLDAIDGREARVSIINEVITNNRVNTYFQTFGNQGRGGQDRHSGGPIMHDGGHVGSVNRMHAGGLKSNERHVIAEKGEFMMQASAVDQWGLPAMQAMNEGRPIPVPTGMMSSGGDTSGGHLTGNLYLSSGEFLGVIEGQIERGISESNRALKREVRAGKGLAR